MAKFLTTRGIALGIEELIENADHHISLITPFVQLSTTYYDRLKDAIKRGVIVTFVHGKCELNNTENELLKNLDCNLSFKSNLHGKCYANEKVAIVTSFNLYSYSEAHNEEMGVGLDCVEDEEAYKECVKNINFLYKNSTVKQVASLIKDTGEQIRKSALTTFETEWLRCLKTSFTNYEFTQGEKFWYGKDFIKKGVEFTTENGFATIRLNIPWEVGEKLSKEHYSTFLSVLSSYRFYWSSPYTKVSLYHSKHFKFNNTMEEIKYCATGVTKLLSCLKSINAI
ncbi:phospholipase D-like domain-containing protein [Segetibacter aerophilus]|uniref:Phospholipase D-like domain-containing protein n=1 Tax=Segetibacter aerophilus TaxID=670293 RepID=A0A512BG92_9BACT|nr:phospholipase D-like domain-containing protein [Segetibacter aerophilus]GEO10982.1 hypothetical protein SAE01_34780 [Segetibacter aerophilus]